MTRRAYHFYMDETGVNAGTTPDELVGVVVGGLLTEGPIPISGMDWCVELLQLNHAREVKRGQKLTARLLARAAKDTPGAQFIFVTMPCHANEQDDAYNTAYFGLLAHAVLGKVSSDSLLVIHPERRDSGHGEVTAGRFKGHVSALSSVVHKCLPEMCVEVFPSEVHILLGQALVDLALYQAKTNLRSGRPVSLVDWQSYIAGHLCSLVPDAIVNNQPNLRNRGALASYHAVLLSPVSALPWLELTRYSCPEVIEMLEHRLGSASRHEAESAIRTFHKLLWEAAESSSVAAEMGIGLEGIRDIEDVLFSNLLPKCQDIALAAKHCLLRAHVRTHLGEASVAAEALERAFRANESLSLTPTSLLFQLELQRRAEVVYTDLMETGDVVETFEQQLQSIRAYFPRFGSIPEIGKAHGGVAQMLVLSGAPSSAWHHLEEQQKHFDAWEDLSYPVVWKMVALGRGAVPEGESVQEAAQATLRTALKHVTEEYLSQPAGQFLLWGLSELMIGETAFALDSFPALRNKTVAAMRRLANTLRAEYTREKPARHFPHPGALIVRNLGLLERAEEELGLSFDLIPPLANGLRKAEVAGRIPLVTLARWACSPMGPGSKAFACRWREAQQAVAEGRTALLNRERVRYEKVIDYYSIFLKLGPDDGEACRSFLALGGY